MGVSISGIGSHIKVSNIEASRAFYEGMLGLVPVFAYGDPKFLESIPSGVATAPELYSGVTYEPLPNARIEIATGHFAVKDQGVFKEKITSAKVSLMVSVDSLLPLLVDQGIRPSYPIRHYYWGTLEMAIRDPDGFVVIVIAPFSEAEKETIDRLVGVETIMSNPG